MDNKDEVINHLHIIHAFANMAYEDLHEQMFKYMSDWTNDAIKLLKDQDKTIESLTKEKDGLLLERIAELQHNIDALHEKAVKWDD